MKQTVLAIHGGDSFPTQEEYVAALQTKEVHLERMKPRVDWKATLEEQLGVHYEVFLPRMPMRDNADYVLWKLWYERVLEQFPKTPMLIGHSLGAMFLVKYYSEVLLDTPIPTLFLVAPEFLPHTASLEEQLSFTLSEDLSKIEQNVENIVMFHSKDDFVVDFSSQALFQKAIPGAKYITCTDRGHFLEESFPELLTEIKTLA